MDIRNIGASYCGERENHSLVHSLTMILWLAMGISSQYIGFYINRFLFLFIFSLKVVRRLTDDI